MQTKIKELVEESKLIKLKKGYRYLLFIDRNKTRVEDVQEMQTYLDQYNIQLMCMYVDGNPNDIVKAYEAETKI